MKWTVSKNVVTQKCPIRYTRMIYLHISQTCFFSCFRHQSVGTEKIGCVKLAPVFFWGPRRGTISMLRSRHTSRWSNMAELLFTKFCLWLNSKFRAAVGICFNPSTWVVQVGWFYWVTQMIQRISPKKNTAWNCNEISGRRSFHIISESFVDVPLIVLSSTLVIGVLLEDDWRVAHKSI